MENDKIVEPAAEEKKETAAEVPAASEQTQQQPQQPAEKKSFVKKLLKVIFRVFLGIILFLVIALACLLIFLDPIIKGVVENFGPEIAGVRFELESISVKLFRGRVEIKNFYMYNPDDFHSDYAVKLGDVALETDIMSWINKEKAIIREIRLRDVVVNYEAPFPQLQNSNIQAILDNVTKAAEKEKQQLSAEQSEAAEKAETAEQPEKVEQSEATEKAETAEQPEPLRFQLDKLIIDNVQLAVVIKNKPSIRIPLTITLPEMGPVGTDEKGLTGLELTGALATEVVRGLTSSVLQSSDEIYREITKQGEQIVEDVKKTAKGYEEDVKDVVNTFKDGKAEDAIKKGVDVIDNALKDEKVKEIGNDLKGLWNSISK